ALAASLLLAAVQLLPAWEAKALMETSPHYGAGIKDPWFYISFLVPNYYDFGLRVPVETNFGMDYLYLGAIGILGTCLLVFHRRLRDVMPPLAVLAASLILLVNPFGAVWALIRHSPLLSDMFRAWYFLPGITVAVTL